MRILYGVSGEGYGHSSRAMVLGKYLKSKGHDVILLTYGKAYKVLKRKFKTFKVKGLHFKTKKGVLDKFKTLEYNLKNFPKNLWRWKRFYKLLEKFKPELCISDMEPIVPILAFWNKVPLISFDNQHRLTNLKFEIPKEYKSDFVLAREIVNAIVRRARYFIITSFVNMKKIKDNTIIVPPIIREDIRKLKLKKEDKVLVYFHYKRPNYLRVLRKINENFVIYGYDKNKKKDNLEFRKREHFLKDLSRCKAIIGNSGFTLISEAIYLKKPYLAVPLQGQFEQVLNALFLKKSGFGTYTEDFSEKEVLDFLNNLGKYKKKLKNFKCDYNKLFKVFDKILRDFKY